MLQPCGQENKPTSAIISLGANLPSVAGPPQVTLRHALSLLSGNNIAVQSVSSLYDTPCFPASAGPDYINAVAMLETTLSAGDLLSHLHSIETKMGRERITRWGQRTLDLDLLAYGQVIRPDLAGYKHWRDLSAEEQSKAAPEQLILPHPRLQDRAFVLVPLAEIAPDWCHPVSGRTASQMRDDLDPADVAQVKPL